MFIPEFLYRLSARDQQVTWLDPVLEKALVSAPSVTVNSDSAVVPEGRALLLQNVVLTTVPGAGQNVVNMSISVFRSIGGQASVIEGRFDALGANVQSSISWRGSLILTPGQFVRCQGAYNAGVANNITGMNVMGLLIPIGNLQRV